MHNDIAFIALTIVFFVLAGLLTVACDHIIGPDPVEEPRDETEPRSGWRHELRQRARSHPRGRC